MGDGLKAGYDGLTGGFHDVFPEVAVALYQAGRSSEWETVRHLQVKLNRAYRIFEIAGGWRGLEVALRWRGIASKTTVVPFDDRIPSEVRDQIVAILTAEKADRSRCRHL